MRLGARRDKELHRKRSKRRVLCQADQSLNEFRSAFGIAALLQRVDDKHKRYIVA